MKDLQVKGVLTLDSREVAEMIGKRHSDLIRDIETYLQYLENAKVRSQDFFLKSSYKAKGNNRTYKRYDVTKKGCDMIANKLTGQKGVLFTAAYVNRFYEMKEVLIERNRVQSISDTKEKEIEARYNNSLVRKANALRKIAEDSNTPKEFKQVLNSKAVEIITGEQLLPLPKLEERTYTAKEIATEIGTTANMIGRIANKNGLKTDEYGLYVWDKSPYSNKQVQSWRYNSKGKKELMRIFKNN